MKRIFGNAKLELSLKVVEHGNRESLIYESFPCRFLPIPEYFKILHGSENPEYINFKMIITKNVKYSGYRDLLGANGLDYDHAVVALAAMARLHAISYFFF